MNDGLFNDEDFEVPILRPPRRRKSEGDARFRGEYPAEWDRCTTCDGSGRVEADGEHPALVTQDRKALTDHEGHFICGDCRGMGSLKARVRLEAGHRCIRCKHPYVPNGDAKMLGVEPSWREGGWSPCDEGCQHDGPIRYRFEDEEWCDYGVLADAGWLMDTEAAQANLRSAQVEAAWRILTVHHADGDKSNVRWWNLLALCQRCHLEIQGRVVMERVYPHEHSEWFKPYVAAYYAHVYLCAFCGLRVDDPAASHRPSQGHGCIGENDTPPYPHHAFVPLELTREQTMERLDELLSLELAPA